MKRLLLASLFVSFASIARADNTGTTAAATDPAPAAPPKLTPEQEKLLKEIKKYWNQIKDLKIPETLEKFQADH